MTYPISPSLRSVLRELETLRRSREQRGEYNSDTEGDSVIAYNAERSESGITPRLRAPSLSSRVIR
jgi:hypothetical protein